MHRHPNELFGTIQPPIHLPTPSVVLEPWLRTEDGQQVFSWEKRSSDPKAMAQVASRERRLRPPEEPMEAMEAVLPPQEADGDGDGGG